MRRAKASSAPRPKILPGPGSTHARQRRSSAPRDATAGPSGAAGNFRVVIFGRRQLCGDCLLHLFERQLNGCEVRVVSGVHEARSAFGENLPPHVVVYSEICQIGFDLAGLRALCAELAPLPLIVHVDSFDAILVRQIIEAGARAVLPTWLPPGLTGAVLQLVAAGETYLPSLNGAPVASADGASSPRGILSRLTPRQVAVLRLATEGKSNKEIGRELGLDPNTIKFHIASLMDKLGVDNRVRLAVVGSRLLPP